MRVADYIFNFLVDKGVRNVFMVSGGQAMFLVDAVGRQKEIEVVCTHHEQAAGMAAEAYGRVTQKLGVALVTAGPGSMNIVNAVAGGWTDSSPMMVISGQSSLSYVQYQEETNIRQYGIQGIYIKPIVQNITKYFVTVDDPAKILFYLQKAYYYATTGRPGPVWIDVPIDVQKMEVPDRLLEEFEPPLEAYLPDELTDSVELLLTTISKAKRPIFLVGQGVRLGGAVDQFYQVLERLAIPVLTSRLGIDLINSDHRLYVGRPGIYGERAANFAIQNADVIVAVGSRLATALVGYDSKNFGKQAYKIAVDIDKKELNKIGVEINLRIHADVKDFFKEIQRQLVSVSVGDFSQWIKQCNDWKKNYPVVLPSYEKEKPVNSYYFTEKLSQVTPSEVMVLVDTGSCFHVACQAWKIKTGQRFLTTGGLSSMGYWAAVLGVCEANNRKNTIVITGDGSLQMNLQELATIKHYNFPIKVIIFNNNGYLLIRHTQKNYMNSRFCGEGPDSGVWCPDSLRIAEAYGIKGVRIDSVKGLSEKIKEVIEYPGPVVCDVMTPEWQLLIPRVSSEKKPDGTLVSKPYEDMYPFLSKKELKQNMLFE
ncbi:MAG: thiamine pyrophosphate-binding protein [Candidatus Omnitrophica bacterium]|nr:thiamine pyrophosphate-binding protein [Candidatus Omnitrophota bacterium]